MILGFYSFLYLMILLLYKIYIQIIDVYYYTYVYTPPLDINLSPDSRIKLFFEVAMIVIFFSEL